MTPENCGGGPLPAETRWQARLHGASNSTRRLIVQTLNASDDPALHRRARRVNECCAQPLICRCSDGSVAVAPGRCKDRICPRCATLRGKVVAKKVERLVSRMNAPRFVTLTRAMDGSDAGTALAHLLCAFKRLRASREWKNHVSGGVGTIEATYNGRAKQFHVHLHLIVDGVYWRQADLSNCWRIASGGSVVVDIRPCHDRRSAARYISTYIAKPAEVERWPPEAVCEYANAFHGKRLLLTFGSSHGVEADENENIERPRIVAPLCSVSRIWHALSLGSPAAAEALSLLARHDARLGSDDDALRRGVQGACAPLEPSDVRRLGDLCAAIGEGVYGLARDPVPLSPKERAERDAKRQLLLPVTVIQSFDR